GGAAKKVVPKVGRPGRKGPEEGTPPLKRPQVRNPAQPSGYRYHVARRFDEGRYGADQAVGRPPRACSLASKIKPGMGGVILEVPSQDGKVKADRLARDLQDALCGMAVVARPTRQTELHLVGLDDSVTLLMVRAAILKYTGCPPDDLQTGEVRRSSGGLVASWGRCPLAPAQKLVAVGGLPVGWSMAGIRVLEERPLQFFRCLRYGHMAAACQSEIGLGGRCFRCGGAEPVARGCTS
ncbi:hypothetical protein EAI_14409, partial [Harpegnathos saltator]